MRPPGDCSEAHDRSRNGITWSRVPHDPGVFTHEVDRPEGPRTQLLDVTTGGPGLVAVGGVSRGPGEFSWWNAAVWTSPDGLTWTRVPPDEAVFGGPGNQQMNAVTVGGPGLVAVGHDEPDALAAMGGIRAAVWTSPDGLAWARVPHDDGLFGGSASDERSMSGIVGIDAGLVAVGNGIWTSSDGFAWSRPVASVHGAVEDLGSVTALGLRLVAVGGVGDAPAVWIGLPPE